MKNEIYVINQQRHFVTGLKSNLLAFDKTGYCRKAHEELLILHVSPNNKPSCLCYFGKRANIRNIYISYFILHNSFFQYHKKTKAIPNDSSTTFEVMKFVNFVTFYFQKRFQKCKLTVKLSFYFSMFTRIATNKQTKNTLQK